ncbi:MAG: hypothetical protein AB7D33_04395 [Sphingobium sp.]
MVSTPPRELHLFTTADYSAGHSDVLNRLIASVTDFRAARPDVKLRHHLLLQRAAAGSEAGFPEWMRVTAIAERVSLSCARNRMLAPALDDGIADDAVIAFPDDDAWYPRGVLDHILASFMAVPALDLWFCRYGRAAAADEMVTEIVPGFQQTLSSASSNTTVLSGWLLHRLRHFDEALGVGTPAGGGEDTEFAARAFHQARAARFWDVMAVGHRDAALEFRSRYYAGSLRAIAMHAHLSGAARVAWLRKLGVGATFALMGRMSLGEYVRALAAAHGR